ncbi:MAG: MerR family transcriptional regulator [Phycisphaeraceae bacterium]
MNKQTSQSGFTRGQLARETGVNFATVRYYERRGLLRPEKRSKGGYHQYGPDDARRLRFIRRAQEVGVTLNEIEDLLALRLGAETSCADVKDRAQAKILDMQQKIRDLQRIKKALARLVNACEREGMTGHCPILESLDHDRHE